MGFELPGGGGGGIIGSAAGTMVGGPIGGLLGGVGGFQGGGLPGMPGGSPFNSLADILSPSTAYNNNLAKQKAERLDKANKDLLDQYGGKIPQLGDRSGMTYTDAGGEQHLINAAYLNPEQFKGNLGALNALNEKALSQGESPWAKMQLQKQGMEQMNQMNSAAQQAQGQQAQGRAALAMRGGLSGGAAERMARSGSQDLNAARQGVMNQGNLNRANIGIQDEANKNQLLGQAVNSNMAQNSQAMDIGKFNIQNSLAENQAANQYKMQKYGEQMKGFGAGMSANAIANSGKK